MPAGTPRGFNLQNMMSFGQNGMNGMGFQSGGPPFMAGMGAAGYLGNGAMPPAVDLSGMHNPGVMRKGGNRFNQRSGPYDRRGGGGGASGRNSYMGGGGGGSTGGGGAGFGAGPMGGPGGMMRMSSGSGMGFVAQGVEVVVGNGVMAPVEVCRAKQCRAGASKAMRIWMLNLVRGLERARSVELLVRSWIIESGSQMQVRTDTC